MPYKPDLSEERLCSMQEPCKAELLFVFTQDIKVLLGLFLKYFLKFSLTLGTASTYLYPIICHGRSRQSSPKNNVIFLVDRNIFLSGFFSADLSLASNFSQTITLFLSQYVYIWFMDKYAYTSLVTTSISIFLKYRACGSPAATMSIRQSCTGTAALKLGCCERYLALLSQTLLWYMNLNIFTFIQVLHHVLLLSICLKHHTAMSHIICIPEE